MFKKLKGILGVVLVVLVIIGVFKNCCLNVPRRSALRIQSFHARLQKESLGAAVFGSHKTLTYRMYYFALIPMGRLEFRTDTQGRLSVFSFQADTEKTYLENFIKARARIESYFDPVRHVSDKYIEQTEVKGQIKIKEITYDHENLVALHKDQKFKIPEDIHDPLGAFVDILALPLEKGIVHHVRFMTGGDIYILKATCLNIDHGVAEILIDMRREDMTSSHGATLRVWVTADNARIPLLFKSWTPVGYMSVVLEKAVLL